MFGAKKPRTLHRWAILGSRRRCACRRPPPATLLMLLRFPFEVGLSFTEPSQLVREGVLTRNWNTSRYAMGCCSSVALGPPPGSALLPAAVVTPMLRTRPLVCRPVRHLRRPLPNTRSWNVSFQTHRTMKPHQRTQPGSAAQAYTHTCAGRRDLASKGSLWRGLPRRHSRARH